MKAAIRARHYSRRTEEAYVGWITHILFDAKRHPREMGETELESFLTYLAMQEHVSASTQNQALSAILFLYRAPRFYESVFGVAPSFASSGWTTLKFGSFELALHILSAGDMGTASSSGNM